MNIEVRSCEAKAKLSELLRGVKGGNRYTITLCGVPVADMVPPQDSKLSSVSAVDDMQSFMRSRKLALNASVDLKSLFNEGRE
jgi:antitoxin (DNA-binding transcriptional repressor) of toxin-antitoxin stability system